MKKTTWWTSLAVVLLASAACGGTKQAAPADDEGAWMDGATVTVTRDVATGRETVTLTDPASGHSEVMSDEPLDPSAVEWDEADGSGALVASAMAEND